MNASSPAAVAVAVRTLLPAAVAVSLVAGIAGGLARLGIALPGTSDAPWLGRAALDHAALMIAGFLGTVIGIERAVAVERRAAFAAPLASAAGAAALVLGQSAVGAWLLVAAGVAFVAVNFVVLRRQRMAHTVVLLAGALAGLLGNLLFAAGQGSGATVPWWFAFVVLTVAAERLEMTRLLPRRAGTQAWLHGVLALLLTGAAASCVPAWSALGGVLYGSALTLLAFWLGAFDIARRTVYAHGLSRYMALCLLLGYGWLALAGVAWTATALGWPARDAALHALGLGFIVSMVMGHAPVILPAVTGVRLHFSGFFYAPLAALHLSLALRLGLGAHDASMRAVGAALNAVAVALFALTAAGAAVAWRLRQRGVARAGGERS